MYGVRLKLPDTPLMRRCFHSIVAMHQAGHNCDYYIKKYQGKPMEQLRSLLSNMAVGLRRLEAELNVEQLEVTPQRSAPAKHYCALRRQQTDAPGAQCAS